MAVNDAVRTPVEFKFSEAEPGVFDGYGAVFGNVDSHGDVILPGAFAQSIAEHKSAGTMPALFVEHSYFKGGDPLPVGGWNDMEEDGHGLKVSGKISGLDTDIGRRVYGLMKDKVLRGLSIAFKPKQGGTVMGGRGDAWKRQLKALDILAVDIVRSPSNDRALIGNLKQIMLQADHESATAHIADAMRMHRATLGGGNSPTVEQRSALWAKLTGAHTALTGEPMPPDMKSFPTTIREFETWLRDEFGLSNSQARDVAERGFKSATQPRDEGAGAAADPAALKEATTDLGALLKGFSLPP